MTYKNMTTEQLVAEFIKPGPKDIYGFLVQLMGVAGAHAFISRLSQLIEADESYRLTQQQEKTQTSPVQPSESTPKKPGTK